MLCIMRDFTQSIYFYRSELNLQSFYNLTYPLT